MCCTLFVPVFFCCTHTPTTELYTLSLHDALPILPLQLSVTADFGTQTFAIHAVPTAPLSPNAQYRVEVDRTATRSEPPRWSRSEEHTSELQSHSDLVCRLLLEKKKPKHPTQWAGY